MCVCVCVYVTHRWESDDRSLKAPPGISDMSLPWRDLRKGEKRGRKREKKGHRNKKKRVWALKVWLRTVCSTFSKLSTTLRVSGRILTTNGETWVHRKPSLVCTADGCSSGFFTHKINMLAWKQMEAYFSRYLQMQQGVSGQNLVYNYIPLSKAVEQTQTHPSSQKHT